MHLTGRCGIVSGKEKRFQDMLRRWQEDEVAAALKCFRVVNLTGARQCGKTTLTRMMPFARARHFSLDDDEIRRAAESDPFGFVERHGDETIVIDEIQKVPALLNAIKRRVDSDNAKGQYLLTGSSNLDFSKAVSDSLAGRIGKVRLRTLSLGETAGGGGKFLERAFGRDFPDGMPHIDKRKAIALAARGGYPEAYEMDGNMRRRWFRAYLDGLLMKDVQSVTQIRRLDALRETAQWMMTYSSKFFATTDLALKTGMSRETADGYIAALKALYLVDEVKAWAKNDYAKAGKRSKYYAADAGLMANISGWREEATYLNDDQSGKLVESWVYQNLASLAGMGGDYEISQYRDSEKREVDFIIERSDGAALGVEVKAGSTLSPGDFRHLKWFGENMARGEFTGIVLYSGEHALRFGEGYYAVPFSAMGE